MREGAAMGKIEILVVEDEEDIQELLRYNLERDGYTVHTVVTGEQGLDAVRNRIPDLILLDLMLPGMDGLRLCRLLKDDAQTRNIPVIMLTAKGEESDVVVGLELGADDYVTKPFSPKILAARIRTVLRRQAREDLDEQAPVTHHELIIDPARYEVRWRGGLIDLTATEFKLLHFLGRRPGWVFTRQQIVDAVRGEDYPVTERAVDVQIVGLRKKLGEAAEYVETVRGIGYRFRG